MRGVGADRAAVVGRNRLRRLGGALCAASLVLAAACGGDDPSGSQCHDRRIGGDGRRVLGDRHRRAGIGGDEWQHRQRRLDDQDRLPRTACPAAGADVRAGARGRRRPT